MQSKTLDQILQELDAGYAPQRQALQQRLDALPGQAEAQITGLKADQTAAFDEILGAARDRGVGFWGAPSAAQQKYTTDKFIPAVASVRAAQENTRGSLFDALNNINLDQRKYATGLYQQELDRAEQQRQFNEQQNAARAQQSSLTNLFNQQPQNQPQQQAPLGVPGASFKDPSKGGAGGFNFNFGGKPISAVGLAQVNNLNPADIIYSMASSGDPYAADAYRAIVANGGNITPQIAQKYYSLFWGTSMIPAQAPKKQNAAPKVDTNVYPNANKVPGFLGINR